MARTKLIEGVNDLQTTHPDLVKEWDFIKNTLRPTEVSAGSNKKVFWLCKNKHSWQSIVAHRTNGQGCPYCSGKYVIQGETNLVILRPDLVKEWDSEKNDLKPTEVSKYSNKKVWWICDKGHSFESIIANRVRGHGCPYCSGYKVLQGFNDLATTHLDITKEWDFTKNTIKPTEITAGSRTKVWWLCPKGHSYQSLVYNKTNSRGCPYCIGKKAIIGETDLSTTHPELIKEWDFTKNIIKPTEVTAGSAKTVWWRCNRGHSYQTRVERKVNGRGCPYCSNQRILTGETDLTTTHPDLAKEWDFTKNSIRPTEVSAGSQKRVFWVCKKGHSWQSKIASRAINNRGCPYCSGRYAIQGETDLQTTNPYLIKEWDFNKNTISPTEVKAGSATKVWWICQNNHSWQASVVSRTNMKSGCPICSGSISERLTADVLTELGVVNFEREWVQKIGINNRRYDFYLPDLKLCIEIDGLQHFEEPIRHFFKDKYVNRKQADSAKNNYLLKQGIQLLRIPGLDTFNTRLSEINQSTLDESQFKDILKSVIQYFISTRKIPDEILEIYRNDSETNYYQVALQMNKL